MQGSTGIQPASGIESALFIVNRPSGNGRTIEEIRCLQNAFHCFFQTIPNRVFAIAEGHDEASRLTRHFVTTVRGPYFLLSGGGGGTNRALVQGLFDEVDKGTVCLDDLLISSLRLGSGNLVPKYFDMPCEPLEGMRQIARGLVAGQACVCCVYRCTFHDPDANTEHHYGLTMAGLGQFARVPDDIKRWKAKHTHLMRWSSHVAPLEAINAVQYIAFSLARATRCMIQPKRVEQIEVRHADRCERFRLLVGMLLNFDFPQMPIQGGCDIGEPRLVLCCIPFEGRAPTIRTLLEWRGLNHHVRKYEITSDTPVEIQFLDRHQTILALDEDTFTAPSRIGFQVAGRVRFVTGTAFDSKPSRNDRLPVAHRVSAIHKQETR